MQHVCGHADVSLSLQIACCSSGVNPSMCVTWRIHTWPPWSDMAHSFVWLTHPLVLIRMCDMIHSYVWHDSFIRVTWRIRMCDVTHSYVLLDSIMFVTRLVTYAWRTHAYVWRRHTYVWHDSCTHLRIALGGNIRSVYEFLLYSLALVRVFQSRLGMVEEEEGVGERNSER